MAKTTTLNGSISAALKKGFDLDNFKKGKNLKPSGFKPQQWIPVSPAIREALSIPGIPHGHITIFRGNSDSGKTSMLLETARYAQEMGILPVFIITEMKFNWEHAIEMGIKAEKFVDENGNDVYDGNFIYVDRSNLNTIEDVAAFITGLLDDQAAGRLPIDLCFLWDSVGSIPCQLCYDSNKSNNEWNAAAMAQAFGNWVNQRIILSRKIGQIYTNSLICVNKTWTQKASNPMAQPRMKNRGGNAMLWDTTLMITFGNVSDSGTSKLNAIRLKKTIEWAKMVNVQVDKMHIGSEGSKGKVVMTKHGFIGNNPKEIEAYKKTHSHEWLSALGAKDSSEISFEEVEDSVEYDSYDDEPELDRKTQLKDKLKKKILEDI